MQGRSAMAWLLVRGSHPQARPTVASHAASRGGDAGLRGGLPFAGQLPVAKGSRCLRRDSGGGGAMRVKED
ncbi:hypothetical protein GW17_00059861 [Ensete ventricosum]|nr:hypothetical protein GW17_00059861 [Ensete ventricosum]